MGSESIAHEDERNNCFSKNSTTRRHRCLVFKAGAFRYYWVITYSLVEAEPIRTQH